MTPIMVLLAGDLQVTFHAQGEESFRTANSDTDERLTALVFGSLTKVGCPTSRSIGAIESQREGAVVSHISRKTSEMWGTRPSSENQGTRTGSAHALPITASLAGLIRAVLGEVAEMAMTRKRAQSEPARSRPGLVVKRPDDAEPGSCSWRRGQWGCRRPR